MVALVFASGCAALARLVPPSQPKTPEERLAEENERLKAIYEAEHQLNMRLAYELEIARIEIEKMRAALAPVDTEPAETVPAFEDFEIARIRFGLLTGISDWTGDSAADGFRVYLAAEDADGTTLKRKGNVRFELIDITGPTREVLMSWPIPAEELAAEWRSLPPGFRVRLPWQDEVPWGREVLLRATFTDAWGRVFQTSRIFTLEYSGSPRNE